MVVFSCDACGDSLRKKDVQKHYQFNCRRCESLTCVDCKKQFWGDDYVAHTQCITDEDFKYGKVNQHKDDKGQIKQNQWRSNIDALLSDRSTDKRWTPILLEMQKYENVPRKKKPFMNWCKCTMKRFPLKVVEHVFDKLLEINAAMQQAQQGTGSTRNKTEEVQIRNSNPARLTEEDIDEMEVDTNESKKGSKRDKKKSKQLNGNTENNNNANINNSHNKKERKQVECSEHEDEMDCDSRMEHEPQKKNSKCQQPEDDDSEPKIVKFKLKKCIVYILLAKQEPVKMTRILRKVLNEYDQFLEERKASGSKGRTWSQHEISIKVKKIVTTSKLFKETNGAIQLSPIGKAKYASQDSAAVGSD
ncbi:uncharacterized protein C16C10.8-like [Varroa destructor]|uniref:Zinc finger C2H2 LYAR-type domain-containing protein n=1 Tax=Varroa destructor TaxID=109461 RepID=A0A7M7MDS9_VARDE|nr:uncharacterized protein C16C10.8-like [Varroa destructor]XP_022669012.1 uncharacterized protein C16C10.8-like [Varroa destructor]XP_022669013.1 uncharacterized protein C16C10.8-like [Varroa destructor]